MCNCSSATCGCSTNSTVLPIGTTGDQGDQGIFGGYSAEWVFNTTTTPTPASTNLRLNSATYASVTEIYVSDTGIGSLNLDTFLDSLSNNTNYGYIRIFKKDDSSKFWMGQVTAVTDNGADHTLAVTYITSNGAFTSSDAIVLTFSPSGPSGGEVLYNSTTPSANAAGAIAILQSYTLLANQLATNGSYIEIEGSFTADPTVLAAFPNVKGIDVRIGGTTCHSKIPLFAIDTYTRIRVRATRMSTTTLFLEFESINTGVTYYSVAGSAAFFETGFSVSDLSVNTTLIQLRGQYGVIGENMTVTYFKK